MMDTPDELKRDARNEQLRRDGELPDEAMEVIEPEHIIAKAGSYIQSMRRAESYIPMLNDKQMALLYEAVDREREELLELIGDYGQQRHYDGFSEGLKRRSYADANARKA